MNLTETKTIRLLIVEDHQITRLGLLYVAQGLPSV